jgi:hypothetical protein
MIAKMRFCTTASGAAPAIDCMKIFRFHRGPAIFINLLQRLLILSKPLTPRYAILNFRFLSVQHALYDKNVSLRINFTWSPLCS